MTPGGGLVPCLIPDSVGCEVCLFLVADNRPTLVQVVMVGAGPTTLFITQEVNETWWGGGRAGGLLLCILSTSQNVKHFGQLHEVNFLSCTTAPPTIGWTVGIGWMDVWGVRKGKVQQRGSAGRGGRFWCKLVSAPPPVCLNDWRRVLNIMSYDQLRVLCALGSQISNATECQS